MTWVKLYDRINNQVHGQHDVVSNRTKFNAVATCAAMRGYIQIWLI